jgi:hypothetical protein
VSAERALKILQSEKESFVKSRDWYRDQMRAAQVGGSQGDQLARI